MRVLWAVALWLVGLASWPQAAIVERGGVTPFEPGTDSIVLAVRVNGRGPFRFLLDTGSTHTAVSARTAEETDAPVVAKAVMASAAGSRTTPVVRLDTLEVGPIKVPELLASVVDLGPVTEGIDGVIGHDALASLRYTIDFRHRRIVWWPDESVIAGGSVLQLQPSHGRFLIALPQRRSLLRLVPDTGAESLLLFDPDRTLPVTRLPASATLATTSGETAVRMATMRELQVGSLTLRDVPAVVAERDGLEPAEVDGLLPLHLFERVTIDGPQKRLTVEKTRANAGLMFF